MAHLRKLCGATALITIFGVSPAFADLTAQQVWDDWRSYLGGMGYDISATEASSGGSLTLTDLTMAMTLPEDAGDMSVVMSEISFAERGDGSVGVSMPATMPIMVVVRPEGEEEVTAQVDMSHTGFEMVVSGSANDMTYTYSADEMRMALANLVVEGEAVGDAVKYDMVFSDFSGTSRTMINDLRNVEQSVKAGGLTYHLSAVDPEGSGNVLLKGSYSDMAFAGSAAIPPTMNHEDPAQMFRDGLAVQGTFRHGGGNSNFSFVENGQPTQFAASSTGGSLDVDIDAAKVSYGGGARGLKINIAGGEVPFPIEAELGEVGFSLLMPLEASEDEQEFGMSVSLVDLTVADMLWNIGDPQGVLPRDPATMIIDLAGKGVLMANLMDPEVMNAPAPPGMLNSLSIKDVTLAIAGARLTGFGDFTFDNSDLETFGGVPRPSGAVDMKLVGGNGLLDKLVQMGIMPEDDAMSARMMMGLFAVPGDAPDTLNSRIEINDQGHVLANGQRIQ